MLSAMGNQARQLLEAALALPKAERAELAAQIRASVVAEGSESASDLHGEYDPEPDVEKAWGDEITQRVERVIRGEATGVPGEEFRARMVERFGPK
jgi:hypothetical protein